MSVAEIPELTTADEWYHVQSADNPTDARTRGLSAKALLQSICLNCPELLKTDQGPFKPSEDFQLKLKQVKPYPTDNLVPESSSMLCETQVAIAKPFKWQKFHSYVKLLRIAANVLRFLSKNSENSTKTGAIIDSAEFENAEQSLSYLNQAEHLHVEKSDILKSTPLSNISKLALFSLHRAQRTAKTFWSNKKPMMLQYLMSNTPFSHSFGSPTSLGRRLLEHTHD